MNRRQGLTHLRRLYRLALRCSPADVRERHGAEMLDAFAGLAERRAARGRGALLGFALRATVEAGTEGLRERARRRRERKRGGRMDVLGDVRLSLRGLRRSPGLSFVLVATLALGIGASTAVFSVLRAVLFAPLPYSDPHELITVRHVAARVADGLPQGIGGADLLDYMAGAPSVEAFGSVGTLESNLNDDAGAARVTMGWVSPDFFPMIGVRAALGRVLRPDDWVGAARSQMEDPNFTPPPMAVLLGHGLWLDRFGGDREVVGRSLRLNGQTMQVVGVLPPGFALHLPAAARISTHVDVWALMPVPLTDMGRGVGGLNVVARLADGATIERARAELQTVAADLRRTHQAHAQWDTQVRVDPLHDEVVGQARPLLWILFGAVGLLLLISAINVANLIVVRAAAREREFAIRSALGVGRGRVARQLLVEGLVVSLLGAAGGTLLAMVLVRVLTLARPAELPRLDTVAVNGPVLAFTVALAISVALVFGMLPLFTSLRSDAGTLLRDRGSGAGARAGVRLRRLLVTSELTLSVVLLSGAGLLLRSFAELQSVDAGIAAEGVVALDIAVPFFEYRDDAERASFFVELTRRTAELPRVSAAGVTAELPLEPGDNTWYDAYGPDGAALNRQDSPRARYRPLTPGTLTALGVRFLEGRDFEARDEQADAALPVIIDARVAEQFPGGALGRTVRLAIAAYTGEDREMEATVVGVTAPARFGTLSAPDEPTVYVPYRTFAAVDGTLVVRSADDVATVAAQVRGVVAELNAGVPVFSVRTLATVVRRATAEARYTLFLVATFAALALVLAAVGLYGVVSTLAHQRTREIGLRMALGAQARDVARLVVREGVLVTVPGLVLGLVAAALVAPFGRSLLFEVRPLDPLSLAGTAAILGTVAWLASVLPARRAARLDPARTLRGD